MAGLGLLVVSLPSFVEAQNTQSIFSVLDTQGRSVAPASPRDGALTDGDILSAGGRRVQVWALAAAPGAELQVDLRSADFDSFLYVVGPGLGEGLRDDDGGDGLNSRLCVALDEVGEYRVVASSLSGGTGNFTLDVTTAPGASDGTCPEIEGIGTTNEVSDVTELSTDDRTLTVGDDATGRLGPSDALFFESPVQAWAVSGVAGEVFSVDLISDAFDAYLIVEGPGLDELLLDDDGAGRCDARVSLTFPETGEYRVVVSTINGGAGGSFLLVARESPGPVNPEGCMALPAVETPLDTNIDIDEVGSLSYGETASGVMTGAEGLYESRHMQGWALQGSAGDRVSIELRSRDFDSYLYFSGPGFNTPISDDDGAGNLHSRICVELPEAGTYRVLAGPLSGVDSGDRFALTATLEDQGSLCDTYQFSPAATTQYLVSLPTDGRSLGVEQELVGSIDQDAIRHPETNQVIQPWSLRLSNQMTVFVDVESDDFDPILYALGAGIEGSLFVDDAGDGCNARLQVGPGISGRVTLLIGAYSAAAAGDFTLRASENPPELASGSCMDFLGANSTGEGATANRSALDGVSSGTDLVLEMGTEATGLLDGTETLSEGQAAQAWTVRVQAGEEYVFELMSDDFDSMLYLDGPGLAAPLVDDDGTGSLNSRIIFTARVSGTMRLVASALSEGDSGRFQVRAIRRAN